MTSENSVSVIIPTLATAERGKYLFKAIHSILLQHNVKTIPIVIVNGQSFNASIVRELEDRKDIKYLYLENPSQPKAIQAGRTLVETPFFSILDDDDLLFPHAMATRLEPMQNDHGTDVVVTNGIFHNQFNANHATVNISDFREIKRDPLRTIKQQWMLTGASLFRTATIAPSIFEGMPRYLEWTYLAVRLCLAKKNISFVNTPTILHFLDHPFSIDRSDEAILGRPQAFQRILELELPEDVRRSFERYLGSAYYKASQVYLKTGNYRLAWWAHKKMLSCESGWRNLFFISGIFRKAKVLLGNST